MSDKQVAALRNFGMKPADISALDRAQASELIKRVIARIEGDLCTPAQARFLARYGIPTASMTKRSASRNIDAIKKNGWRPPKPRLAPPRPPTKPPEPPRPDPHPR